MPALDTTTEQPLAAGRPASALSPSLAARYREVRGFSERLCEPLVAEDYVIQSMADVSPTKWHLAHTSWFFETFVLTPHLPGYQPFHADFTYLFNSYYNAVGERHCRPKRGLVSRPTVAETYAYRAHIDKSMLELLESADEPLLRELTPLVTLGCHHEQQHQELMVTDIKHVFTMNPLRPIYRDRAPVGAGLPAPTRWVIYSEGLHWVGHEGRGFCFDNEGPRHREFLQPFALASRLVTNGEFQEFVADGGYARPELWLSMGWATACEHGWKAPFYWEERDGRPWHMTLAGMRPVEAAEPVCHVSYFEADSYARWAGARLPGEAEWEVAADGIPIEGNFVENGHYHPVPATDASAHSRAQENPLQQMFGDVWQWTRSQYTPYPGYSPPAGALGEYNGKFMCNQFVLRGGSCATSRSHIRHTYRNFFPPDACWQFTGIRLAKDI